MRFSVGNCCGLLRPNEPEGGLKQTKKLIQTLKELICECAKMGGVQKMEILLVTRREGGKQQPRKWEYELVFDQ